MLPVIFLGAQSYTVFRCSHAWIMIYNYNNFCTVFCTALFGCLCNALLYHLVIEIPHLQEIDQITD